MKATGIIRRIDELGRVVMPKELRRVLNIPAGTPLEFYVEEGNKIVLKKYEPDCIFCGDTEDVKEFSNKKVCKKCINKLQIV